LVARCSEQVEFDSQSLLEPIFGREQVERYLTTEIALADAHARPWRAVLGLIDAERSDQPGVILLEQQVARAFWSPTVQAGEITRIFGYTLVPPPQTARRLEDPRSDSSSNAAILGAELKARFREAPGPIRFHGFAVSRAAAKVWLGPKLAELQRRFAGSEIRLHLHDGVANDAQIRAATAEKRHYEIVSYPAICVERAGTVYRTGHAPQSVEAIAADISALLSDDTDQ